MATPKYNGWTNYQTWCVALWLSNDRQWQDEAERFVAEAADAPQVKEGQTTALAVAKCALAAAMQSRFRDDDFHAVPALAGEILRACEQSVNWEEIAEHWLEGECTYFQIHPTAHLQAAGQFRFPIGKFVSTPGALGELSLDEITVALNRHVHGDWGLVGKDDAFENELALQEGFRLLSAYESSAGVRFWIITEADRSVTTILLPSEY